VITALYKASQAGVKVDLIVRGICCLRPGVKGVSENIRVISIVGKHLEHPRIFYFKHAKPQIFFSSADWMPRNLVRRIELMTPVHDGDIAQTMLAYLRLQLADTKQSRQLGEDGEYHRVKEGSVAIDSQSAMEDVVTRLGSYARPRAHYAEAIEAVIAGKSQ
jgi:polyphosphate kinase